MLLHLSQFAAYITFGLGALLALIMWLTCRHVHPAVDAHGRNVLNWIISSVIYAVIGVALCLVLIGVPLLIVLAILGIVFPIIGAVRASRGVVWSYPLSIPFLGRATSTSAIAKPMSTGGVLATVAGIGCLGFILLMALVALLFF